MRDAADPSVMLTRECSAWSRYLVDRAPSAAVIARYLDAHEQGIVEGSNSCSTFDRALVRLALIAPFFARLCDVHARIFRRAGLLRRKLVLTLALLESDRQSHARVDETSAKSRLGLGMALCVWLLRFALLVGLGACLFLPLRLVCGIFGRRAETA